MLAAHVQEENNLPPWKQPPPNGFEFPQLPAEDPNRSLSVAEYHERLKTNAEGFQNLKSIDITVRTVILNEIENSSDFLLNTDRARGKLYPGIACRVYRRTGVLLTVSSLRRTLQSAIGTLRSLLAKAIWKLKLDGMELEQYLWNCKTYPSIRFYRQRLQAYEQKLRNRILTELSNSNGTQLTIQNEDDDENENMDFVNSTSNISDDIEIHHINRPHNDSDQQEMSSFYHTVVKDERREQNETEPLMDSISSHGRESTSSTPNQERQLGSAFPKQERNQIRADPIQDMFFSDRPLLSTDSSQTEETERTMGPFQQFTMEFSQHFKMESFQQLTMEPFQQFTMEHRVPSTHEKSLYESDPSFYYLSNQIERVSRENPSKRKLLHDILLQIVLAFDQNNHTNPGSIFDQLKRIFDN